MKVGRSLLLAAGAAALTGLALLAPGLNAQSLLNHNSNAPVDYAADRIELQDKQNRVILDGSVSITQAGLNLRAARMTVAYRNQGGIQVDRIDATGGVRATKGDETASGDVGIYDLNRRIITMVGNVALNQGGNTLRGNRLVIDLRTGRSTVDGRAGSAPGGSTGTNSQGQVTGRFTVPQRDDE